MAHILDPLVRKLETESSLSAEERQAVSDLPVITRHLRAGNDVVCDRDRPSRCCLVLDGWLFRHKILENGLRQIFSFHLPGDIPDLQSLRIRTMDRSLSALTPTTVAFIPHEAIRNLIRSHPRIGEILWRETLIDSAIFREWMIGMGCRQAPERIAHLMCEMFEKMRAVGLTRGSSCHFPVTQGAIADALGLSTVHVNRSIMDLRGRGLITLEKQALTVPNLPALQAFSGFDPLYLHMEGFAEAA